MGFGKDGEGQFCVSNLYDDFTYSLNGSTLTMYVLGSQKQKEIYTYDSSSMHIKGSGDNLYMTTTITYYYLDRSTLWNFDDFKD